MIKQIIRPILVGISLFICLIVITVGSVIPQSNYLKEINNRATTGTAQYFESEFIALLLGGKSKISRPLVIGYKGKIPVKGEISYQLSDDKIREHVLECEKVMVHFTFGYDKRGDICSVNYEGEKYPINKQISKEQIDGLVRKMYISMQSEYCDFIVEGQDIPLYYVDTSKTGKTLKNGICSNIYKMEIYQAQKRPPFFQEIIFTQEESQSGNEGIQAYSSDFNFDGHPDIRLCWEWEEEDGEYKRDYKYWIYNEGTEQFEEDIELSSYGDLIFSEKEQRVYKIKPKEGKEINVKAYDHYYGVDIEGQLNQIILGGQAGHKKISFLFDYPNNKFVYGSLNYPPSEAGEYAPFPVKNIRLDFILDGEGIISQYRIVAEKEDGIYVTCYQSQENFEMELKSKMDYVYKVKNKDEELRFRITARKGKIIKGGEFGEAIYNLKVYAPGHNGKLLQRIDVPADAWESEEVMDGYGLEMEYNDYNFDGYLDFSVRYMSGNRNTSYNYWLWNKDKMKYISENIGLKNLYSPYFHQEKKQIENHNYAYSDDVNGDCYEVYKIKNGKLALLKQIIIEDVQGHFRKVVVLKYDNGKKQILYNQKLHKEQWAEYRKAWRIYETELLFSY